jgi:hypothetical protein
MRLLEFVSKCFQTIAMDLCKKKMKYTISAIIQHILNLFPQPSELCDSVISSYIVTWHKKETYNCKMSVRFARLC